MDLSFILYHFHPSCFVHIARLKNLNTSNYDFLNNVPGMKETNNQFMESLNSYNDMFEKMINIDPTDDPKRIKASLDKHLNAVIDTTTSTIEKSAETLNKQVSTIGITHSKMPLPRSSCLGNARQHLRVMRGKCDHAHCLPLSYD